MTDTQQPDDTGTVTSLAVSRSDLISGDTDADASEELIRRREIVRSAVVNATLLLAGAGDLRRLDIWRSAEGAVVHSFVSDVEAPAPSLLAGGGAAWLMLAELMAEPPVRVESTEDPSALSFGDVESFIAAAVDAEQRDPLMQQGLLLRTVCPGARNSMVARATGTSSWWCRVAEGEHLEMTVGGVAQFWAAVSADLEPRG